MILMILLVFVVLLGFLIGLSVGMALLLHWLLPAIGLDMALLIAVIAVGQAMLMFGRFMGLLQPPAMEGEGDSTIVVRDREFDLPRRRRKRR